MHFDCIIPTAGKDCILLRKSIPYIFKFIKPDNIYIITNKPFFIYFKRLNNKKVILIDENELLRGVNFKTITTYLENVGYKAKDTGWYFQQFLKMGFSLSKYAKKYYLSWDADSIPINPISFFNENDKPFFTMKEEYHEPYFITLKNIFNLSKLSEKSFISENMLFDTNIMIELIGKISNSNIKGENWCEKIINSLPDNRNNSFSEFETYGNYVLQYYPEAYKMREINTFRDAGLVYSRNISEKQIKSLANKYDMISLEHRHNPTKYPKKISSLLQKLLIMKFNKLIN